MGLSLMQPTFGKGEVSPSLYGRVDLAQYKAGLASCLNAFIMAQGGVKRRSGFEHIAVAKEFDTTAWNSATTYNADDVVYYGDEIYVALTSDTGTTPGTDSTVWTVLQAWILPFRFSRSQAYVMEFGHKYIRVYTDGGQVQSGGSAVEIVTTYTADQVNEIRISQSADVLYLYHPEHAPAQLSRTSHTAWTLENLTFKPATVTPQGLAVTLSGAGSGTDHSYKVTAIDAEKGEESLPSAAVATTGPDALSTTNKMVLKFGQVDGCNEYYCYKEENGAYGYIGKAGKPDVGLTTITAATQANPVVVTAAGHGLENGDEVSIQDAGGMTELNGNIYTVANKTDDTIELSGVDGTGFTAFTSGGSVGPIVSFTDNGIDPDSSDTPPTERNPFDSENNYPSVGTIFQQRHTMSGTNNKPDTLEMSQSASYLNLTKSFPPQDDDACTFMLAGREVNPVCWMIPLKDCLIVGTAGAEWKLQAASGNTVTPSNVSVVQQTFRGSENMDAILVGDAILFVQHLGRVLREFRYTLETDGFSSPDLTALADHLLQDYKLTDWSYQQTPRSIVWAVRSDGTLLGLTYMREHDVVAWHRHETQGWFKSVACIPGENSSELWAVVKRKVKYQGWNYSVAADTGKDGDTFTVPDDVTFSKGMVVHGADPAGSERWFRYVGSSSYTASGSDLPVTFKDSPTPASNEIESIYSAGDVLSASWEKLEAPWRYRRYVERLADEFHGSDTTDAFFVDCGATYSGSAAVTISGLDHLEGLPVQSLADGMVHSELTVEDGQIRLNQDASTVRVGLGYNTEIKTLRLEAGSPTGVGQGRVKAIASLKVLFHESLGEVECGPDENTVDPFIFFRNDAPESDISLFSGWDDVGIDSGYKNDAVVFMRQSQPLPFCVLAIVPEIITGRAS